MQNTHTKRLFVAIKIAPEKSLEQLIDTLKTTLYRNRISWVRLQNMHLTLKFLGDTPASQLVELHQALSVATLKHRSFEMEFNTSGIFGSRYQPRVIWLGPEQPVLPMQALATDIMEALHHIGFKRDRQNFVPHLTLGRIKQLTDKNHFQQVMQSIPTKTYQRVNVNEINLYESILKPTGAMYTVLQKHPL